MSERPPSQPEKVSEARVRLRSQDFLARTGDRTSILQLLEALGNPDAPTAQYALEKVFGNPEAHAELMDPESQARMRAIHRFSEQDPHRAVRFARDTLARQDKDSLLLSLDVLDSNVAYLEPGVERLLAPLMQHREERVRVKSARLLLLLAEYIALDFDQRRAARLMEKALDSRDPYCRRMAYDLPAAIFYKM